MPDLPRQTTWQFFRKFVRWGLRDLKRHYQPIPYSETRGPNYYRPLGYDDRPLRDKLRCKYFWTRTVDHLVCGLVTWYYDNRRYFHKRFPDRVNPVTGPLEDYLPPLPKRFPDEFIRSERERMKRLKMPPSEEYEEFTYDAPAEGEEENKPSLFGIGKMFGDRLRKRAGTALQAAESKVPGIKDLKEGNVSGLQSQAQTRLEGLIGEDRKRAVQAAVAQGQDIARLAAKGDVKGAAANVKEILDQKMKDNEALKEAAKEKASGFQEVVSGFVQGYMEGKQYEEIHHTDPKELLARMQENARKAVFLAAKESPSLLSGEGDIQQRLKDFATKAKDLDSVQVDPEEERKMKELAAQWLSQKGKDAQKAASQMARDFAETEEGKALRARAEEVNRLADQARARGERLVEQARAEAPGVREQLGKTVEAAKERLQQHREGDGSTPKKD